jgi:hypothetical protein
MKVVRGVVMEICERHLVILTNRGDFLKVPHPGGEVQTGQEISSRLSAPSWSKAAIAAACFAAAALLFTIIMPPAGLFPGSGEAAYGYINLDINPSFEIAFNDELMVTGFDSFNDEALFLLEGLSAEGNVNDFLAQLIERACRHGYLKRADQENLVMVSIVQPDNGKLLQDELYAFLENKLTEMEISCLLIVTGADHKTREAALAEGLSVNRYMIARALQQEGYDTMPLAGTPLGELLLVIDQRLPFGRSGHVELKDKRGGEFVPPGQSEDHPGGPPEGVTTGPPGGTPPGQSDDHPGGPPEGVTTGPPGGTPPGQSGDHQGGPPEGVTTGPPEGVKTGPPVDHRSGPPEGVTTGPPEGITTGPPEGVTTGPPGGTPPGQDKKE